VKSQQLHILVVEDDAPLRVALASLFESQGHRIDFAADGVHGLSLALETHPDVVVLDLGLPRMDGIEVCRAIREKADRHVPILMLTSRQVIDDKLAGFAAGADDYLVKPFSGDELLARCVALSRRHRLGEQHAVRLGDLLVDRRQGLAYRDGRLLHLNQTTLTILLALVDVHPRPLTRSELIERIWGGDPPPSDPLRTHVYMLRREIDPPGVEPMLRNVHGVGYRLQLES
jgi:DNA-binding response OmpR family regulator